VFYYLVKYIPVSRNRAIDANRLDGSFIRNGFREKPPSKQKSTSVFIVLIEPY
jgi:hypothetical protein